MIDAFIIQIVSVFVDGEYQEFKEVVHAGMMQKRRPVKTDRRRSMDMGLCDAEHLQQRTHKEHDEHQQDDRSCDGRAFAGEAACS